MKRRVFAAALACALSLTLLASCGTGNNNGSAASNPGGSSTSQPDASTPDASQPDASGSASTPDASQPDASGSASAPDASQPDGPGSTSAPDSSQPGQSVLTLNRTDFTLKSAGASWRLKYTCEPDMDAIAEFSSSDEAVATVAQDGTVTAVSPGTATITLQYGDLTATCIVRCRWETEASGGDSSSSGGSSSGGGDPAPSQVDLTAFYATLSSSYEFPSFMAAADKELMDVFYPNLSATSTQQCLVYANQMSMNMGELVLVQVTDSKDVDGVKAILQARIDNMVNGGAWYPEPTRMWSECSTVVSNGNYIMMVVHENYSSIVNDFNALF